MRAIEQSSFIRRDALWAGGARACAVAMIGGLTLCCAGCSEPAVRPPAPTTLRAHNSAADHFPTAAETMIRTPSAQTK
jgi:hypothetical protein